MGRSAAPLGSVSGEIEALSGYMTVSPEDNDSRVHLAALRIDDGRENDGLTELGHVLSEVPDHEDATRVLHQLEMLIAGQQQDPQGV